MKKFYQVCYGKPSNNWQIFNYSDDASSSAISFYEKNAVNNTPQNFDYSKLGESEYLCEIVCQDGFIETSRVKYGMVDNFGRPMMFSHGFVFNSEDGWLENPNNIVAISEDNFHFTVEETSNIPIIPKYNDPFTIESAKSITKLSNNQIKTLMGCVNLSLASSTNFSLYIVFKGTIEEKKALMYLIFSLLPYSLRYQICVSTSYNFKYSMNKSFMIIDEIPDDGQYFDLVSGNTNMDLEILDDESKYPFLKALFTYGIYRYSEYCSALNEEAKKMSLPYICDYDDLVYADIMLHTDFKSIEKKDNVDLTKFLLDFSSKVPLGNIIVDEFIYKLLKIYIERNIQPNEILINRIRVRNEKTKCDNLKKAYKHLQMIVLVNSGEEKTVQFLKEEKSRNIKAFSEWVTYILDSNGSKYIDKYYSLEISKADSFPKVISIWNERKNFINDSNIDKQFKFQLRKIASSEMSEHVFEKDSFNYIIEEYSRAYLEIFNKDDIGLSLQENLFNAFWEQFDISSFEFDNYYCTNLKEIVKINNSVYAPNYIEFLLKLQETIEFVRKNDFNDNFLMLEDAFSKLENYTEIQNEILQKLDKYVVKSFDKEQDKHIVFWYKLASIGLLSDARFKAFDKMIDWKLDVILSEEAFKESLDSPRIPEYINRWIYVIEGTKEKEGYLDQYDSKDDRFKLMKNRLSLLKSKEKQLKKEQKKLDKKSSNDSNDSLAKKAFPFFKRNR